MQTNHKQNVRSRSLPFRTFYNIRKFESADESSLTGGKKTIPSELGAKQIIKTFEISKFQLKKKKKKKSESDEYLYCTLGSSPAWRADGPKS